MENAFGQLGYRIERSLFSESECKSIFKGLQSQRNIPPLIWPKGLAITRSAYAMLAKNDRLVDIVSELLGEDVILWGAVMIARTPNQVHQWHDDIESSSGDGFVSIWM